MHPFASYVLRCYYQATGWNEDNLFTHLTRSSDAILDFTVPKGLHLAVSKSPNALFRTTYSMNAMPFLTGSVGYIFTSCNLDIKTSSIVNVQDMVERFKIYDQPRRPEGKEEVWSAGERVETRDYLLYGRFYLPTRRLDALYSTRLTPTLQAVVAAISELPTTSYPDIRQPTTAASNVMFHLQHDVGKWCTEYTYSAEDSMWGLKFLHNFGRFGSSGDVDTPSKRAGLKRVDEEEPVEGGLKGRLSAGAELYFSAKERSAGLSTGVRFTTLPDATPPSLQLTGSSSQMSQPPTTITALYNPMLGHLSGAYSAKTSPDLSLSSRFDFNVYSFESEWAFGAEWWMRRRPPEDSDGLTAPATSSTPWNSEAYGVVKARASTSADVSLMWEGRIKNMMVSFGVVSDLSSRSKPIKAIGLDLSYFSSG